MKKFCFIACLILPFISNRVTAQTTAKAQERPGFVPLVGELVVVQSKAIGSTLTGTWKVPAGGAFKIRVIAKGAGSANAIGVNAEPGDIVSGEFIVYSGQTLHYSLGLPGQSEGNSRVYLEGANEMITAAGGFAAGHDVKPRGNSPRSTNTGTNQKITFSANFGAGEVIVSILAVCGTQCGGDGGSGGGGSTCNSVAGTISSSGTGTVCSGTNSTTFTVSGYQGAIQWESSTDNSTFSPIPGETGTSYTATNLTQTTYYRVVVTDGACPSATSSSLGVTVSSSVIPGTISGAQEICSGGTASLTLSGYTDAASIQWQSSTDNQTFSNINNATSASYTALNVTVATYYQAVVNGCSQSATSPSVGVTIYPTLNPGTLGGGATVCPGTNNTLLTLTGATAGATVEWDSSTDNQNFVAISGATGTTYTATDLSGTAYYRVLVSNQCGHVTTDTVQVNVTPNVQAGTITGGGGHVCTGTNSTTLTLSGSLYGTSIHWDSSADNKNFVQIANATGVTYTATNLSAASYYQAEVANVCGSAKTAAVQITVDPLLIWVLDADKDGHYVGDPVSTCYSPGAGWTQLAGQQAGDCNDNDDSKWQSQLLYIDYDRDQYDSGQQLVCYGSTIPSGYATTTLGADCNDHDATTHAAVMYYADADHDGHGSTTTALVCASSPPLGYSTDNTDCNDNNATVWQSAILYIDYDGDGYTAGTETKCYGSTLPTGYSLTSKGNDCNDNDALVHDILTSGSIAGGGVFVCPGTNSTTLTLSGNSSGTIQWQLSTNNTTFNKVNGQSGQTYTAANLTSTTYYRAVISAGTCPSATTTSVAITMGTLQNATALSTSNITSTTATLNWVSSYNPGQWQLEYKSTTPGSKWIDPPLQMGSVRSLLIKNLQPNQSYQWHIRANCGKTWTDYSVAITFKTLAAIVSRASSITGGVNPILAQLQVKVLPNPTNTNFSITVEGNSQTEIVRMIVVDMYGRTIEQRILSNEQTITLGDQYRPGTYFVEFIQGDRNKQLRLIKLPN